ncbi:hypothetical protein GYMLUDRAFT_157499 [Collybiopsis luxurians FD-317 M1]|nr:hypothetical protein GYMLUDRAFT_157499 [Collybiopsis luxurians FD-317 M1]
MPALSISNTTTLPLVTGFLPQAPIPPVDPDPGNSCSNINSCRTRLQIIWSCIAVLIACTWASIHPNVPGPKDSWWIIVRRKIGLMLLGLLAPELLVLWAARQWADAWLLSNSKSNSWIHQGWTVTHAMFALMGGFALYQGNHLVSRSFAAHVDFIGHIPEHEIKERSHVDWFGKLIAIGQTSWFIAQLIARWAQRLAVTELEIMTVAFATLNFMTYYFWWSKPLEVGYHIRIQAVRQTFNMEIVEVGNGSESVELFSSNQPLHDPPRQPMPLLINIALYQFSYRNVFQDVISWYNHTERVFLMASWLSAAAAMIFGAIHCVAWNFVFPTDSEQLLWRISSVFVTFAPFYIMLIDTAAYYWIDAWNIIYSVIVEVLLMPAVMFYVGARLVLIVQPFLALRDLPLSALQDVAWTTFIPHI